MQGKVVYLDATTIGKSALHETRVSNTDGMDSSDDQTWQDISSLSLMENLSEGDSMSTSTASLSLIDHLPEDSTSAAYMKEQLFLGRYKKQTSSTGRVAYAVFNGVSHGVYNNWWALANI